MSFLKLIRHIIDRRRQLLSKFEFDEEWEVWAESCIPSYCHPNIAAALLSWWRLFKAIKMAGGTNLNGEILDFGSSIGELYRLLPKKYCNYWFVERDDRLADILHELNPGARRDNFEARLGRQYDVIFALDALEHNDNFTEILTILSSKLTRGGRLIISGPTENIIYKFGRWISGYRSYYHKTSIYEIEKEASKIMNRIKLSRLPPVLPLFRLSVWEFSGEKTIH